MRSFELELPWESQPTEAVGMTSEFGQPLFGYLPTARGQDLSGNNCPISQDTAGRAETAYGVGATFGSGKWIQYDATRAGGGASDANPVTRVYIVQYGAQGFQWLSHSNRTGSSEIVGHGWSSANLNCQNTGQDVILGTVTDKFYVIVIRANLYGQTTDAWVNGALVDSWTITDGRSGSTVYLGRRSASDAEHFTGKLLGAYTLRGLITANQINDLYINPWRVFEPHSIEIQVPDAGAAFNPAWAIGSNVLVGAAGAHA